jgi:hypothetical protein
MKSAGDGDNKPDHRGEHEGNRNTIAQGMPGQPVNLWRIACVLLIFARKAAGASMHPAFPAPS